MNNYILHKCASGVTQVPIETELESKRIICIEGEITEDIDTYQANYRKSMKDLLDEFDVQILSSYDLDAAVYAIVDYANLSGMALQHTDFSDFKNFLNSDEDYVLK